MAKRVRIRLGNPKDKYAPSIIIPGRSKKHAIARAKNFLRKRMKNVALAPAKKKAVAVPTRSPRRARRRRLR
ncbi:MAG: hypothetical protein ACRD3D_13210 [Terriglobia bacterium]